MCHVLTHTLTWLFLLQTLNHSHGAGPLATFLRSPPSPTCPTVAAFFFFTSVKCCPTPELSHLLTLCFQRSSARCPLGSRPSPIQLFAQILPGGPPEPPFRNHSHRSLAPWSHFLFLHLIAWHYLCFFYLIKHKLEIFTKPPPRWRRVRRNKEEDQQI